MLRVVVAGTRKYWHTAGFCGSEFEVNEKSLIVLTVLFGVVSCDKPPSSASPGAEEGPQKTRVERSSRGIPTGRDQLRVAFEAAKSLEFDDKRNQALAKVAWEALETVPDIAAMAIRELPTGSDVKNSLMEAYLRKLIEKEKVEEALMWSESFRDTASARSILAMVLSEKDPAKAANFLEASSFAAPEVDPAVDQVLRTWVRQNPGDAISWTTELPAGKARTTGLRIALSQWLNSDATAAFSWVSAQSKLAVRQEAVDAIAESLYEVPDLIRDSVLGPVEQDLRSEINQRIEEIDAAKAAPSEE